eukprot:CAMPEP_0172528686 /NCGR_PEP_ID=MMETSP1067-20121228/3001_1 /TAXON_ID=265564 ORGANISM="Thalassiosira punctigera, Strain Tpunct2005C2" /NCGR_SAMPLE_ID=MMETSP1067 /ASSEMBLY_ACC=CAM_ASM_000444 /LENGTH=251 /DNA_ID=CAMNT_0013312643 /DNA_START=23 /DNA_END=778 /DNA_ORIENTATION=+
MVASNNESITTDPDMKTGEATKEACSKNQAITPSIIPTTLAYSNSAHASAERPIPDESTWKLLRDTFVKVKAELSDDLEDVAWAKSLLGGPGNEFNVSVRVQSSPGKGRGVFAAEKIPEGTVVVKEEDSLSRYFYAETEWNAFLERLPRDLACDCAVWAWVCSYETEKGPGEAVGLDFSEGSLLNHGSADCAEKNNLIYGDTSKSWDMIAARDIEEGGELLTDYGDFHDINHKLQWYTDACKKYAFTPKSG